MKEDEILRRMAALVSAFRARTVDPSEPVVPYRSPEALSEAIDLTLPSGRGSAERMLRAVEQYLEYCVRTGHRQYFNQLWGGFSLPGFVGDVFTSLANTSMYTYEVAPVATLMERTLTANLGHRIGYHGGEALFVPGASYANLVGVLAARNRFDRAIKDRGLVEGGEGDLVGFVSDQAHYSFLKAANLLGIGMENMVSVATDAAGRMIPERLDEAIRDRAARGKRPFFVGATAGTTVLGAFDPFEEIGEIARVHRLWYHVDAALGGSMLLSRRHRGLLRGSETSDSFSWNLHKLLGVSLQASLIFTREKGHLHDACASEQTGYLFHDHEESAYDTGPMSLQCGRKVDILKAWIAWQYWGDAGWEERMNHLMDLAGHAEARVREHPRLTLVAPRQSIAVCFRIEVPRGADPDRFHVDVRQWLLRHGRSMVNYATLPDGRIAIRLVLVNADLTVADVDRFFENVLEAADAVAGLAAAGRSR